MRRLQLVPRAITVLGFACLIAGRGCSQAEPSSPTDAGVTATQIDASDAVTPIEQDAASVPEDAAPDNAAPSAVPAGWIPFDDYSPSCGFYLPGSKTVLPPPIQWEACAAGVAESTIDCRQMSLNWPKVGAEERLTTGTSAVVRADGSVLIQLTRFSGPTAYRIVAEADGPVHSAILETTGGAPCTLGQSSLESNHVVYHLYEADPGGSSAPYAGAAVGGAIDERPRVLMRSQDKSGSEYVAGASAFLENTLAGATAHPWSSPTTATAITGTSEDQGQAFGDFHFVGDDIFWTSNTAQYTYFDVWNIAAGSRQLLGFGQDTTRSPGDLGTDGVDLVWSEGSSRSSVNDTYPEVIIKTSPYTNDPSKIAARRLRSEYPSLFLQSPFVVGCGRAAHLISDGTTSGVRVIRLSDGASWRVMSDTSPASAGRWQGVIALSCTEVFSLFDLHGETNLMRMRLETLSGLEAAD